MSRKENTVVTLTSEFLKVLRDEAFRPNSRSLFIHIVGYPKNTVVCACCGDPWICDGCRTGALVEYDMHDLVGRYNGVYIFEGKDGLPMPDVDNYWNFLQEYIDNLVMEAHLAHE